MRDGMVDLAGLICASGQSVSIDGRATRRSFGVSFGV